MSKLPSAVKKKKKKSMGKVLVPYTKHPPTYPPNPPTYTHRVCIHTCIRMKRAEQSQKRNCKLHSKHLQKKKIDHNNVKDTVVKEISEM